MSFFYQSNDPNILNSSTHRQLNQGLKWYYSINGGSNPDNVVETSCNTLFCQLFVSNSKHTPENFSINRKIIGPQGTIYPLLPSGVLQVQGNISKTILMPNRKLEQSTAWRTL